MTQYYIYPIAQAPEALLAKHPNAPIYQDGELYLFCESLEFVTGEPTPEDELDDSFIGGESDEDYMYDLADRADYAGDTPEERQAARVAARVQARVDARVAFRVAARQAARQTARKEYRMNKRQGDRLYAAWLADQPEPV